ncbi:CBS domain-containing protein [Effusibacillus lacus]|uniref:CBS domain-containing protein n=1 Tax=Effusibacillus lacus TaxID=1348429 RepID=A0A292YHZ4_9BACL|nr:CBS domain-containing protein [Effusibacillus lacus]TCS70630.1 CBS domain protein [Effusibacillus lacus]GAX90627.1 CBS domain-containing protein [Effusibacillus lacus]
MKLRDLMTSEVKTCSPNDSVVEAAKIMRSIDVGIVPVVEGDKLVGVVTDRDIVLNVVAEGQDVATSRVANCMTSSVVTGTPEMDAHVAADLMAENQIRRLPVVENGRLVGIVAIGDLATVAIHENEAGYALSEISEPSQPQH